MNENNEIKLDPSDFKALSSETRTEILKELNKERYTVTDLAEKIDISKSTMHEHLSKLEDSNLIERKENGNKWIYYELTKKGKRILNPHSKTKLIFLISLAGASLITGAQNIYSFTKNNFQMFHREDVADVATETMPETTETARHITNQTQLITGVILIIVALYFVYKIHQKYIKSESKLID